jgi:hypothetical protein
VLLLSVLLFVLDDEEAYGLVRVLCDALAAGSYIAISHPTEDNAPHEQIERAKRVYDATPSPVKLRSRAQAERFLDGLELVEPGVVLIPLWRPEGPDDIFLEQPGLSMYYGGIGRKP